MDITKSTTRQERAACFHAHMQLVAAALDGFVYQPKKEEDTHDWQAMGELISGKQRTTLRVTLHLGNYQDKTPYRAECCGVYPRNAKGENYTGYGQTRPSIGFVLTRTASQIAGDITRRLLPEYNAFFTKVAQWVQTTDAAAASLDATRELMREAGFEFSQHMPNEGKMYFARGEKLEYPRPSVYVYGGSVDLKIKYLDPEAALRVLEMLNLTSEPSYV